MEGQHHDTLKNNHKPTPIRRQPPRWPTIEQLCKLQSKAGWLHGVCVGAC